MADALIGYTGFVGGTLQRQRIFDGRFRSTNIDELPHRAWNTIYCAGAPGRKWFANQQPQQDREAIDHLITALKQTKAKRIVLLSTVDVYEKPSGVDEEHPASSTTPYGRHRLHLEDVVRQQFASSLVVRLPGLVGDGLRKNVLYDVAHGQMPQGLGAEDVFQFYPVARLADDIDIAWKHNLSLLHLVAEPMPLGELLHEGFGKTIAPRQSGTRVVYDVRSRHVALWSTSQAHYHVKRGEVVQAVKNYAKSAAREKA